MVERVARCSRTLARERARSSEGDRVVGADGWRGDRRREQPGAAFGDVMARYARARSARRLGRAATESRRARHGWPVAALACRERPRGDEQDALGVAAERLAA